MVSKRQTRARRGGWTTEVLSALAAKANPCAQGRMVAEVTTNAFQHGKPVRAGADGGHRKSLRQLPRQTRARRGGWSDRPVIRTGPDGKPVRAGADGQGWRVMPLWERQTRARRGGWPSDHR